VFTLIAAPFGLRPARGSGTGFGFALSLGIAFSYFVIASISSAVFSDLPGGYVASTVGAWIPNVVFTFIGIALLRRAAEN
jgi:lipopolysaccharide export LptBFGC system permease protein LptF